MNKKKLWILPLIALILFSCNVKKQVTKTRTRPKHHNTKYLLQKLHQNEFHFDRMNMRAAVTVIDSSKKSSFHANIRIRKDSAIWISIQPLFGIELARVLITKDTVLFIDRIHRHYFAGNFDFINKEFNIDIDYNTLESILLGNSIPFDEKEKIHTSKDSIYYYLGMIKERKYRKAIRKDKTKKLKHEGQTLWLTADTYKIKKLLLSDFSTHKSIKINYDKYEILDNQLFPSQLDVNITSKKTLDIKIDYTKLVRNKNKKMVFNIPKKYVRIQ